MPIVTVLGAIDFRDAMESIGKTVDAAGVAVIVCGVLVATARAARGRVDGSVRYRTYRQGLGKAILLGLEMELEGRWPWQRGATVEPGAPARPPERA